jgi:GTP pyrophosphokinase
MPDAAQTADRTPASASAHTGPLSWLPGFRTHPAPPAALEPVLAALRVSHPKASTELVERAYTVAARVHEGQFRKDGEPYITHPVAVATILAELGLTASTLAAALLHDTVEDTPYSLEELRDEFGEEIALMVDGVTKLDRVEYGEAAQSETVRKMVVATAKDIRVLLIKLADRLHNARTWKYVPAESAEKKARETLEIYAPLAHRLGMNTIKWELEDLAFATLHPRVYEEVVRVVAERAPARDEYLRVVSEQVKADLRANKIKAVVTGRPKHYYSIYQKMIVRGRDFADIYDLVGVRILVDEVQDCYAALGAMHARWNPVPGRFKDYIAMPKFNMYQSLHTTVIGPSGKPVEIQIRTHEMHRRSVYGVAAHWKYKEGQTGKGGTGTGVTEMDWLRQLVDWQRETQDPGEFLDSLRYEIGSSETYVFTPKGDVLALPAGSTPVDFAYAVHTEVGHRTVGARVNSRLVALDTELQTGDVVEIFTSKAPGQGPSRDWLGFVRSPRARNKIRQWFTRERREEAVERGRDLIGKEMRKQNLPLQRLMSHESLVALANELRFPDVSALYAAVGEGRFSAHSMIEKLMKSVGGAASNEEDIVEVTRPGLASRRGEGAQSDPGVAGQGLDDVWVKLARCCTPVPPDQIIGFITRGSGVSVHRADCSNLAAARASAPERVVDVAWREHAQGAYLVQIQLEALDRHGLLSDVTRALSESHVNILSAEVSTTKDRVAINRFVFELADASHLDAVLAAVRRVDGVFDAYRITGSSGHRK